MKIKICTISDIHLGNNRNKTEDIIRALDDNLLNNPAVKSCNILFIAGDLFDRLLAPDAPERTDIFHWFVRLCKFCARNSIILRILEGTPSHDWKQSEIFPTLREISETVLDFKYIKNLSIEHFDKYNVNVLYMPDEWRPTAQETLDQVKELLKSKGIETVDFGVFHGNFEYQLPMKMNHVSAHSSEEYLKLVKHLIFIGHIHTHSRFERIVAQGSFDRLSHNEEEPKGFVIAEVNTTTNTRDVFFIENKDARVYKTIDCSGLSLQETIEKATETIKHLPANSNIRIAAENTNPIFTNMDVLLRLCPTITWSKKDLTEKVNDISKHFDNTDELYKAIQLTKDNLPEILLSRSIFKNVSVDILQRSIRHLQEVL